MDLDEWELIPSTKSFTQRRAQSHVGSASKEAVMLGPDLFVETNYFKLPGPAQEEPEELKDIAISPEFEIDVEKETSAPALSPVSAPAPAPAPAPTVPVNWLEPDPLAFGQGTDGDERGMEARKAESAEEEKDCVGFTLWGLPLPLNGIAAICSFSVATAATLCVFALGGATSSSSASASCRFRANPSIQFQIYSDDKRIKDVVQRTTGLNHAMSAARGVTAQISFGGHYQGL